MGSEMVPGGRKDYERGSRVASLEPAVSCPGSQLENFQRGEGYYRGGGLGGEKPLGGRLCVFSASWPCLSTYKNIPPGGGLIAEHISYLLTWMPWAFIGIG